MFTVGSSPFKDAEKKNDHRRESTSLHQLCTILVVQTTPMTTGEVHFEGSHGSDLSAMSSAAEAMQELHSC